MKKSLIIIIGLALLAGGLTFSLLTFYVQPTTVVAARQDLAAGDGARRLTFWKRAVSPKVLCRKELSHPWKK